MSQSKRFTEKVEDNRQATAGLERRPSDLMNGAGSDFPVDATAANDPNRVVEPIAVKSRGYFQFSRERLVEIARLGLGANAMAAYLVLSGGVNGRNQDQPRVTSHSANSVTTRTMMSRRTAEKALAALEGHGFIQRVNRDPADSPGSRSGPPQWQVDPAFVPDVALDQGFLAVPDRTKKSADDQPHRGSLAYLMHWANGAEQISRQAAIVDALVVFAALHEAQDFGGGAGVDPLLVGGCCKPIAEDDDGPGTQHAVSLDGPVGGLVLLTEATPEVIEVDEAFAEEVLGVVPLWEDAPDFATRFRHAIAQLEAAGLVYRSHIVWDHDPINPPRGRQPEVLFTLHAGRTWVPELETQVADCIHTTFCLNTVDARHARFADSRGESPNWVGSGIYRYVLPQSVARHAKLVMQLRARWWPSRKQTLNELELDRARNQRWRDRFIEIGLLSSLSN